MHKEKKITALLDRLWSSKSVWWVEFSMLWFRLHFTKASFGVTGRRKIVELLIEEVKVTNGKVEIVHILPLTRKGNLQLQRQNFEI